MAHSALVVQAVSHAVGPHTYGSQAFVTLPRQLPAALQVPCVVSTPEVQEAAMHSALLGAWHAFAPVPPLQLSCTQLGTSAVQSLSGSVPAGTAEQMPSLPATSHAAHVAPQAVSQQKPSTQLPVSHSSAPMAPLHTLPCVSCGWHMLVAVLQKLPTAQSALVVQLFRHAVPPHTYGSQLLVMLPWQLPVLQVPCVVSMPPAHEAATHTVPLGRSHAFAPSVPLQSACMQLGVSAVHSLSGSVPAAYAVQVPSEPANPQEPQVSPQAVSQQKPSTQLPVSHSSAPMPPLHALPCVSCGWQVLVAVLQKLPARQSALVAQVLRHAVAPQM
jgi:hypothetical protein